MASPVLQILREAKGFAQHFAEARNNLNLMAPSAQEGVAVQLEQTALTFSALQEKVEKFLREQKTIPGASRAQVQEVCTVLSAAAEDLEIIDKNTNTAAQYWQIAKDVDALYNTTSVNPNRVASLEQRITNLTNYRHLNQGNREAYEVLSATLQTYHPQPNSFGHAPSSSVFAHDTNRRATIGGTDEDADASLFLDRYKDLETKLGQDPIKNFKTVLTYYRELKKYSLSHPTYVSQRAGQTIAAKLQETEKLLQLCIDTQANKEKEQVQQAEKVKALTDCYYEIVTLAANTSGALDLSKVNTAYAKLQNEDKENFILSLRDVLQKNISLRLQSEPIANIPGTWEQKKEAMQKITPTPTRTKVTNLDLKGPSMTAKFEEVKNMQPTPVRTPSSSATTRQPAPSSQPPSYPPTPPQPIYYPPSSRSSSSRGANFPSAMYSQDDTDFAGMYLPEEIDISSLNLEDVPRFSTQPRADNMQVIHGLQALAVSLNTNGSSGDLAQLCQALQTVKAERPYYHLYVIHKNKSPKPAEIDDPHYGKKAFAGTYPATNEERRRSVQRTIVELVLENLEDAINFESGKQAIKQNLKLLDEVKLDAKDCPQDKGNIHHLLFEFFYKMHKANRQFDKSLIDPDMGQYKGKFGEAAFPKSMGGIDPSHKISAIGLVRTALKTVWKVE